MGALSIEREMKADEEIRTFIHPWHQELQIDFEAWKRQAILKSLVEAECRNSIGANHETIKLTTQIQKDHSKGSLLQQQNDNMMQLHWFGINGDEFNPLIQSIKGRLEPQWDAWRCLKAVVRSPLQRGKSAQKIASFLISWDDATSWIPSFDLMACRKSS